MRIPSFESTFPSSPGGSESATSTQHSTSSPFAPTSTAMLTSGIQLCLAHYCDIHGPTPLMVTEGLPVPCSVCYDDSAATLPTSPPTSAPGNKQQASAVMADTLRKLDLNKSNNTDSSVGTAGSGDHKQRNNSQKPTRGSASLASSRPKATAMETPPDSPRRPGDQPQPRRDSSFRRTYDDNVTKRAGPCENCAMTLPQRQQAGTANEESESARNPTLRTRMPWEKVYTPNEQAISPPASQTSSASDTDGEGQPRRLTRRTTGSTTTRSSMSSTSRGLPSHAHFIHYTSTHEPLIPNSFSIVRASCLRALSFETLPRTPQTGSGSGAQPHNVAPNPGSQPFVTTHSAGSAVSGGPIFFGDPSAGYTTAYIFRIPDIHARGHKRVYAFLALSTHSERVNMKTFGFIAGAFQRLAEWIQKLAKEEAERAAGGSPMIGGGPYGGGGGGYPSSSAQMLAQERERDRGSGYGGPDRSSGSSFLSGGSALTRRMTGGAGGLSLKSRGLAELVGLPDFFIQLHQEFVQLLVELGVKLSS